MNNETYTILIVDDNSANLSFLFDLLDNANFKVLIAQDGKSAIKTLETTLADIIILDIMMPIMDGFETCRQLKSNEKTKKIPIIFITALNDTTNKIKGFTAGAVDYITKPIDPDELLARINTHLTIRKLQKNLEIKNEELKKSLEREKALMRMQIKNAKKIQQSLLPYKVPKLEGFEMTCFSRSALEVGGDFYEFVQTDENIWKIILGDVSGKGMGAALYMAVAISIIKFNLLTDNNISFKDDLDSINKDLCSRMQESSTFVALSCVLLHIKTNKIILSNAAGNHIVYYSAKDKSAYNMKLSGTPLGILTSINCDEKEIIMQSGDILLLTSDGVTDAKAPNNTRFHISRLLSILNEIVDKSSEEIVNYIIQKVDEFADNTEQEDDISIIVLKKK